MWACWLCKAPKQNALSSAAAQRCWTEIPLARFLVEAADYWRRPRLIRRLMLIGNFYYEDLIKYPIEQKRTTHSHSQPAQPRRPEILRLAIRLRLSIRRRRKLSTAGYGLWTLRRLTAAARGSIPSPFLPAFLSFILLFLPLSPLRLCPSFSSFLPLEAGYLKFSVVCRIAELLRF